MTGAFSKTVVVPAGESRQHGFRPHPYPPSLRSVRKPVISVETSSQTGTPSFYPDGDIHRGYRQTQPDNTCGGIMTDRRACGFDVVRRLDAPISEPVQSRTSAMPRTSSRMTESVEQVCYIKLILRLNINTWLPYVVCICYSPDQVGLRGPVPVKTRDVLASSNGRTE